MTIETIAYYWQLSMTIDNYWKPLIDDHYGWFVFIFDYGQGQTDNSGC